MNEFSLLDDLDRANGVEPEKPKAVEPFTPATLPGTPELPPPGIYFGMPEEQYHALPALSASGIKKLAASPMIFWASCTWLSEAARTREAQEAEKQDAKSFRTIGKAYHCRLLEGAEEYAKRFACQLSPNECKDALESTDQIKAAIKARGQKPVSKVPDELPDGTAYERAAVKADWIDQLLAIDPDIPILSELQRQHAKSHAGKQFIPWEAHEQILVAAQMIEADPQLKHATQGGYPEVTLIWYCAETGVPMKARVDRLKLKAAVDLKSVGNDRGLPFDIAIRYAIGGHHYNVQPSVYVEGIQAVKRNIQREGPFAPEDWSEAQLREVLDWVHKWTKEPEEPEWWWLFQQKGLAPITRLVRYPLQGVTRTITDDIIRQAKRAFLEFAKAHEPNEPWIDSRPPYEIADEDLPSKVTENLRAI